MSTITPRPWRLKTGESVIVRAPVVADAQRFVEIMRQAAREGPYTLAESDEVSWTNQSKREDIQEHLEKAGYLALVADLEGQVVGFLEFENGSRRRTEHSGMFSIFIDAAWREKGVGSALIKTLLDWAAGHPIIEKVTLAVFSSNSRARAVYEKLGFQVEGRCPRDMKVGATYIDSILMYRFVKPISAPAQNPAVISEASSCRSSIANHSTQCTIFTGNAELLPRYVTVPIAYRVERVLVVELINNGLNGMRLREEIVDTPYVKDYDLLESPLAWPEQFDLRQWGVLLALNGDAPVGGATLAYDTQGVAMLQGRTDLAVLWDIRVHPDWRRRGVGTALFEAATRWSRLHRCRQLKIETQNVNVPACRFYARQGCRLGEIDRYAYAVEPSVAHEVMLTWYLDL